MPKRLELCKSLRSFAFKKDFWMIFLYRFLEPKCKQIKRFIVVTAFIGAKYIYENGKISQKFWLFNSQHIYNACFKLIFMYIWRIISTVKVNFVTVCVKTTVFETNLWHKYIYNKLYNSFCENATNYKAS